MRACWWRCRRPPPCWLPVPRRTARRDARLAELAEHVRRRHDAAPDKLSPYVYRLVSGQLSLAGGVAADGRLHVPDRPR